MKDQHSESAEDAFVTRIASRLREPVQADDTFETRAMGAVRAAARENAGPIITRRRSWWMRRSVRLTPVVALAMAAGVAAVAIFASRPLRRSDSAPVAVTKTDTVHLVRFMLLDASARQVALVGTFNQWEKNVTLLEPAGEPGVWTVSVPLPAGRHEYAFVVQDANGERWVADRIGQRVRDDFGVESSVVSVGTSPTM